MAFQREMAVNISVFMTAPVIFSDRYAPEIEVDGVLDVGAV